MFLLGAVAIYASVTALIRFYTVKLPPMLVPASVREGDAGEPYDVPAPDLIEWQDLGDGGM